LERRRASRGFEKAFQSADCHGRRYSLVPHQIRSPASTDPASAGRTVSSVGRPAGRAAPFRELPAVFCNCAQNPPAIADADQSRVADPVEVSVNRPGGKPVVLHAKILARPSGEANENLRDRLRLHFTHMTTADRLALTDILARATERLGGPIHFSETSDPSEERTTAWLGNQPKPRPSISCMRER